MRLPLTYFCSDPCLQGFVETLPPQAEWDQYTTLDPGTVRSTYIFPFAQFRCNGTLERVTMPYSLRRQDSSSWDDRLGAEIVLFRPVTQGYMELMSRQVGIALLTRNNIFQLTNDSDPFVGTVFIDITWRIEELDVLGLKLPTGYTAQTLNVEVKNHIPILMSREKSSPVLRRDTSITCQLQSCSYQVADFLAPVISVEFLPMKSVQGAGTNTSPEGKLTLTLMFNSCSWSYSTYTHASL